MAAGGGGVHGGPQLVVLGVDASSLAEQDLHHLLIVVDATLGGGIGHSEGLLSQCWFNISAHYSRHL